MKFKIGFACDSDAKQPELTNVPDLPETAAPRRSVVQVGFPGRGSTLAYYNDRFDLHAGDWVYVDGKLAGQLGRVTHVSYNFKIKLSDYKQVIAVADTHVTGQFFFADSHLVTFDPQALSPSRAARWFLPPAPEDEDTVSGSDESAFPLSDLKQMNISSAAAQRGHDYYLENRVRYICLQGEWGYAIVEGSRPYEVEFQYRDGRISGLTCSCFCSGGCKHQFAAMLQLSETLEKIEADYANRYEKTGFFAAVFKPTLFRFAVDCRQTGSLTLD